MPHDRRSSPQSDRAASDWADFLRPALTDFNHYLDELETYGGGQKEVVGKKNKAVATFDRNYSRVVRLTELFYQLAGLDSLAKYLQYQPWSFTGGRPKEQVLPKPDARDVAAAEADKPGPPRVA